MGLLLTLASIPLSFQIRILNSTVYSCDLVFIPMVLGSLVHISINRLFPLKKGSLFLFFAVFLLAILPSVMNARDLFRFAGYFYIWAQIPIAYFISTVIIKNNRQLNIIFYTILTTIIAFSVFFIFYFIQKGPFGIGAINTSYFFHHNIIATYIGIVLPLFMGLIFLKTKTAQRIIWLIAMAISMIAMIFTTSHWGSLSAFFAILLFLIFYAEDKDMFFSKQILFFSIIICTAVFAYMYFLNCTLYNSIFALRPETDSLGGRVSQYKCAIFWFTKHPIIGVGLGNFLTYTGHIHAHNMFLQILTETGLIGMVGFSFMLWGVIKYLCKILKESKNRYITKTVIISLICFFLINMLDFTLGHGIGIMVGLMLAIVDLLHSHPEWEIG